MDAAPSLATRLHPCLHCDLQLRRLPLLFFRRYVFQEAQPISNEDLPASTIFSAPTSYSRRKAVVLGDTVRSWPIAPLAAGADVLSHEATFSGGMEAKARVSQHSTGWMAGEFARSVGAQNLVLTHFSARYGPPKQVGK